MEENEILTNEESTVVDDLSAEMSEVAEPNESEESTEETTEQAEPEVQNEQVDINAIYAEARRVAESNARKAQKSIDEDFARRFAGYKNPLTGQPIRSQADYLAALDAQDQIVARKQLENSGVDPRLLDNAVANNPVVRQAQAVMQEFKQNQTFEKIDRDLNVLHQLDPNINSLQDVPPNIVDIVMRSNGSIDMVDAYKIVNYGRVSEKQQAAIKQDAINLAKGKQHLNPVNGVATPDEGVEIPSSELNLWKEMFPNKSKAEMKKLYNQTIQ